MARRRRYSPTRSVFFMVLAGAGLAVGLGFLMNRDVIRGIEQGTPTRAQVLGNPNDYLEVRNLQFHNKGLVNSYRQVTGFQVRSRSPFRLTNIEGEIQWLGRDHEVDTSVPFTLRGSIRARGIKQFDRDHGTLVTGRVESSSKQSRVVFKSVAIVD